MQRRTFTYLILGGLIGLGWISKSAAQTITTVAVSPSNVCVPATISVSSTLTGSFGTGNTFTVQLSGPTGSFSNPLDLVTTGSASPLNATLPADLPAGNGYKVRVVSSTPVVIDKNPTGLIINAKPGKPTVAKNSYSYCVGTTADKLEATASAGNTLQWYEGNTKIATNYIPPTSSASNKTYSVTQVSAAGCESDRVNITVEVIAKPVVPTGASTVEICAGSPASKLEASVTIAGATLNWYDVDGKPLGNTAPTPPNNAASTFKVTQTDRGCEGTIKVISVTIKSKSANPTVETPNKAFCFGQAVTFDHVKGKDLKWYNQDNTPRSVPTPTDPGEYPYKVTQNTNGCESDKADVKVTINKTADPVPKPNSYTYCQGEVAKTLEGTVTGGDIKWYTVASGGTSSATGPTPSTTDAKTTYFYVSQTLNGCESGRAEIKVQVNETPKKPTDQTLSLCQGTSGSSLNAGVPNPRWYAAATGGSPIAAPTPNTGTAGDIFFYFSQVVGNCESAGRAEFKVTIKKKPDAPTVKDSTYCYGATTVALTAVGPGTKNWYKDNTLLTKAPIPSNEATSTYKVSQTVDGCESDKVDITTTIIRTDAPKVPLSSIAYCVNETAEPLKVESGAVSPKWYGPDGKLLSAAPTPSTTVADKVTIYTVTQTKNGCESAPTPIQVKINARPEAPGTTDLAYCQNAPAAQLTAGGSNLKWYNAKSGGTLFTTTPTPSTGAVGTTSYFVSQTNGSNCESNSRAELKVTINPTPLAPTIANALVEYCQDAKGATALAPTIAAGNTAKWYLPGGSTSDTAPVPPTTTAQTTYYQVTQTTKTNGMSCEGPKLEIKVVINPLPGSPDLTTSPLCQTRTDVAYKLTAKTAGIGTGLLWYTEASGGTGSTTSPTISLVNSGDVNYYVSQTVKGCEGERFKGTLTINPLPAKPTVPAPLAYCQSTVASSLSATPSAGGSLNWYGTNATGGNANGNAPVPSTAADGESSYYVSQSVKGCEGDRSSVKVTVRATPLPGVDALKEFCQNAGVQPLIASGDNLRWYNAASGGTVSTSAPIPATNQVNTTSFYVSQTKAYTIDGIGPELRKSPRQNQRANQPFARLTQRGGFPGVLPGTAG